MKKLLMAAAIMGISSTVSAGSNQCNYSMDFDVDINEERILFSREAGKRIEFKGDTLLINGQAANLSHEQLQASKQLQKGARKMVPEIAEIAVEGAELGIKVTTMVLTSLFGDDKQMQADLIVPIEKISEKIKQNITETSINTKELGNSFENAFDDEFEKMIETAVTQYSGRIVSNVLSSIFSGDSEELADLEFRMENLEHEIEEYAEANAKQLESKAEALCRSMANLDKFDSLLEDVKGYPEDGLLKVGSDGGYRFTSFSYN